MTPEGVGSIAIYTLMLGVVKLQANGPFGQRTD